MKFRDDPSQLNTSPEEFQLEDILREFGSASTPTVQTDDPEAAPRPDDTENASDAPELSDDDMKLVPDMPKKRAKRVGDDTAVFEPIRVSPKDPQLDAPMKLAKIGKQTDKTPHADPADDIQLHVVAIKEEKAPDAPPSPKEVLSARRNGLGSIRLRLYLQAPVLLAAVLLLLYDGRGLDFFPNLTGLSVWLSAALLLWTVFLAPETLLRGLRDLFHLRISLYTLVIIAGVLSVLHSLPLLETGGQSYCCVVVIVCYFLQKSIYLDSAGQYHTLRTVCGFDNPMGIYDSPQLFEDTDSLRRSNANVPDFMEHFLREAFPQSILRIYATAILPLSAAIAYLLCRYRSVGFVEAWLLLLLGAIPCGAMLSYYRPFSALAKRLSSFGGALCGWHGATIFGGRHSIILRDEDLFPLSNISSNGMKLYGSGKPARVIAYALSALEAAGSPLAAVFDQLLHSQYGKRYHATAYRFYDDGGIGAEVLNDTVLVGSLPFMRSMGVQMPEGAKVRQAVYVSVNGELAGVFAIKYKPSASTRKGLRSVLVNHNFSVVLATRDFLITPELLAAKYELNTETIIYPAFSERIRLSEIDPNEKIRQGGLIAKDTFGAFASTVAAGHTLRICSLFSLILSMTAGILGFVVCALLIAWNAASTASPLHIGAFQLLWHFSVAFISFILMRF